MGAELLTLLSKTKAKETAPPSIKYNYLAFQQN
jgi:hypothetical protein